jgi:hypothetical protein
MITEVFHIRKHCFRKSFIYGKNSVKTVKLQSLHTKTAPYQYPYRSEPPPFLLQSLLKSYMGKINILSGSRRSEELSAQLSYCYFLPISHYFCSGERIPWDYLTLTQKEKIKEAVNQVIRDQYSVV